MTQPRHPRRSVALLLFLGLVALLQAAPVKFDIPAQPAPAAIELFIKQSTTRVAYVESDLSDITANAVVGEHEPAEALTLLLKGTPCTISERRAGWFSVVRQAAESPGFVDGSVRDETGRPLGGARVSLAGSEISATTTSRGRFSLSGVPAGEHVLHVTAEGIQNTRVTDVNVKSGHRLTLSPITVPAKTAGLVQLEDYVVSAKRNDGTIELDPYDVYGNRVKPFSTANLDLTRTRDDALPFLTFSARDIELSGALNLQEFFRARLAQDFSTAIPGQGYGDANAPTLMVNTIDMRGWGAQETVILLNGRRMPGRYAGNASDGNFTLADFTTIPMSAIERVEILPAAGSAIYGANATGGVINIITRRDYRGGQLSFSYESPADTHAPRLSVELNYGMPVSQKTHVRISAGYQRYNPLEVGDRAEETTLRWYRFMQARDPSRLVTLLAANPRNTTSLLLHGTPNIRTVTVNAASNLFGPGTPNYTSVPAGYAGGQGIQPFLARQGQYSFEMGPGALSAQWGSSAWRGAANEIKSASFGIDRALGDQWRVSLEALYQGNLTFGIGNYAATHSGSIIVPANAPTNPFGQAVYVDFDDPRMNRPELQRYYHTEKAQLSVNLQGEVGEWRGYIDLAFSRDTEKFESDVFSSPWGGWQEAFNSGAYNPFVDVRTVAPAATSFYERYVSMQYDMGGATRFYQASLRASGPLYELPAGPIQLTLGGEWTLSDRYDAYYRYGWFDSQTGSPAPLFPGETGRFDVNLNGPTQFFKITESAAYAEANVPVIAPKQKWWGLERFDVFVSGRVNERIIKGFRSNGTAVTGQSQPYVHAVGVRLDPLAGMTFRVSQSIGFKPPTLVQMGPPTIPLNNSNVIDRRRNNESLTLSPTAYITGGNASLKPETTNSRNFGLILSPTWMGRFRISVDYLESLREDAVSSVSVQQVLDLEDDLPGRVQREPAAPGSPGGLGRVTFVDATQVNLREISSKSVDFSVEHQLENVFNGRLITTLAATRQLSFRVQSTATSLPVEQVGNPSGAFSRGLKWNGNAQVRWESRRWTLGWAARYFDELLIRPADIALMQADRAPWALNHDVSITYRIPPGHDGGLFNRILEDSAITLGSRNVFNRMPRLWATATLGAPFDSSEGRTVWLQIRKNL